MRRFFIKTKDHEGIYLNANHWNGNEDSLKFFKDDRMIACFLYWEYWIEVEDENQNS